MIEELIKRVDNKIKFEECIQISDINKEINKILLLYNTHNLVCSYAETLEIFQLKLIYINKI